MFLCHWLFCVFSPNFSGYFLGRGLDCKRWTHLYCSCLCEEHFSSFSNFWRNLSIDQVASYSVVQSKPLSSSNSPRYTLELAALLNYLFRLTPFFRLCLCVFCSRSAGGRVGSPINSAGRRRNEASGHGQYCNMLYTHHQKSARASKILFSSFVNTY